MTKLSVKDLAVTYSQGRAVFPPQAFEIVSGEILGLLGPSGSGKSTLLRAMAGLIPCAGEVRLDGRTADEMGWPLFRRRVLYVHQRPLFLPGTVEHGLRRVFAYRSAREEASASARDVGRRTRTSVHDVAPPEDVRIRAIELLGLVGLDASILSRGADTLSVGEGQRVAFVRALLVEPSVLLLDEPTSALDAAHRDRFETLLVARVREAGGAGVLVTHDAAQAERLCSSVRSLE
ncbi:MAG: ABC transporter ATP-binding protein [Deltaproteobacteria bacterium]|nr:ABC transporter ATP-binding protein [Deltaproteobacteria bacterium]